MEALRRDLLLQHPQLGLDHGDLGDAVVCGSPVRTDVAQADQPRVDDDAQLHRSLEVRILGGSDTRGGPDQNRG